MTRQLIVQVTCDFCNMTYAEQDVALVTWDWNGVPLEFDTCDSDAKDLPNKSIAEILEASRARSHQPEKKPQAAQSPKGFVRSTDKYYWRFIEDDLYVCPGTPGKPCGLEFPSAGGMATHFKRGHGKSIKDVYKKEAQDA